MKDRPAPTPLHVDQAYSSPDHDRVSNVQHCIDGYINSALNLETLPDGYARDLVERDMADFAKSIQLSDRQHGRADTDLDALVQAERDRRAQAQEVVVGHDRSCGSILWQCLTACCPGERGR